MASGHYSAPCIPCHQPSAVDSIPSTRTSCSLARQEVQWKSSILAQVRMQDLCPVASCRVEANLTTKFARILIAADCTVVQQSEGSERALRCVTLGVVPTTIEATALPDSWWCYWAHEGLVLTWRRRARSRGLPGCPDKLRLRRSSCSGHGYQPGCCICRRLLRLYPRASPVAQERAASAPGAAGTSAAPRVGPHFSSSLRTSSSNAAVLPKQVPMCRAPAFVWLQSRTRVQQSAWLCWPREQNSYLRLLCDCTLRCSKQMIFFETRKGPT